MLKITTESGTTYTQQPEGHYLRNGVQLIDVSGQNDPDRFDGNRLKPIYLEVGASACFEDLDDMSHTYSTVVVSIEEF
jgi:hypothetical protein